MGPGRWGLWAEVTAQQLHCLGPVSSANQGRSARLTGSVMQVFELKPRTQDWSSG